MKIDTELLDALLRKMIEAGVNELELREGEQRVMLCLPAQAGPEATPEMIPVRARGMGVLRLSHPYRKERTVTAGQKVLAGDILGFLEAGMTLTPIIAPCDGMIANIDDKEGNLIGFGETVMVIEAT